MTFLNTLFLNINGDCIVLNEMFFTWRDANATEWITPCPFFLRLFLMGMAVTNVAEEKQIWLFRFAAWKRHRFAHKATHGDGGPEELQVREQGHQTWTLFGTLFKIRLVMIPIPNMLCVLFCYFPKHGKCMQLVLDVCSTVFTQQSDTKGTPLVFSNKADTLDSTLPII